MDRGPNRKCNGRAGSGRARSVLGWASGFRVKRSCLDISVGNGILMREFIVPIGDDRKFKIEFIPSNSPFPAFVNAIEAFTAPKELFKHDVKSPPRVSPEGGNGYMENITSSFAFNPIYRINVGGERVEADRDQLRRTWIPDAPFIFSNISATNASYHGNLHYQDGSAAEYDAPYDVYSTAKQLNTISNLVNITWQFNVSKSSMYLVRAHFCDIGNEVSADKFNFSVYSHFNQMIPVDENINRGDLYVPFYADFVVDSASSDVLKVSIGRITTGDRPVFLNGLEIMELLSKSDAVSPQTSKKNSKKVYIVVGCVIGGVALMLVLLLGVIQTCTCTSAADLVPLQATTKDEANQFNVQYAAQDNVTLIKNN